MWGRRLVVNNGNGKRLHAIGGCYLAAVTKGLLDKALIGVDYSLIVAYQFLIPLHRAKIGGGEKCCSHGLVKFIGFPCHGKLTDQSGAAWSVNQIVAAIHTVGATACAAGGN